MNSDAEKRLRDRAKTIIRNYSIASGTASGALAIGALWGVDTAFSISIVTKMVSELAQLCGTTTDEVRSTDQFQALIKKFVAISLSKSLISFIPVIGNVANGVMTYYLIESIGWAVYEIFRDGRSLSDLTEEEIEFYVKYAEENKAKY
ncbi:hypothetical protein H6F87_23940 [Cyanobacteria bacterium FACHB-502]|nr:hypothetical protein [Cyanobacteria bacterium FACHB-502]